MAKEICSHCLDQAALKLIDMFLPLLLEFNDVYHVQQLHSCVVRALLFL